MPDAGELIAGDPLSVALKTATSGCHLHVSGPDLPDDGPAPPGGTVSASLLSELLLGQHQVRPRRMTLESVVIDGDLDLESASLEFPLLLRDCRVEGDIDLADTDTRRLMFERCRMQRFNAEGMRTKGTFSLSGSHLWQVHLAYAHISDKLDLRDCRIDADAGSAVYADLLTVEASVLAEGLIAHGAGDYDTLRFGGAKIDGQLNLSDAWITASGEASAFLGDGIVVGQDIGFRKRFIAFSDGKSATIRLLGAEIGGQATFSGTCVNSAGSAIDGEALTAEDVSFGDLDAHGSGGDSAIDLTAVTAKGRIEFSGGTFGDADTGSERFPSKIELNRAQARLLTFLPDEAPDRLDLANGHFAMIMDSKATWPQELELRGCVYDELIFNSRLEKGGVDARLAWLSRCPSYDPQPYAQLAAHYRSIGDNTAARKVAIAGKKRRAPRLSVPARLGDATLRFTVGYGYKPGLALIWLVGLATLGAFVFGALPGGDFTATRDPSQVPALSPFVYTLDLVVPVIDLGQRSAWATSGTAQWLAIAFIVAGWTLTTALVVGVTSALRSD
jgi:hypothetical protein